MKVLVIGNNVRSIVCSAKRGGYMVYALDKFCDVDTRSCADASGSIENADQQRIYELAGSFGDVDGVILGPGFENLKFKNILGNRIEVSQSTNDKLALAKKLRSLDIPHPETEPLAHASGLRFPLMIKPRCGSGGMRNAAVFDEEGLSFFQARSDAGEFIVQEFVNGIPCSASLIGTGDKASVIALNEQLIGIPYLTRLPFAYCGNVTPFITEFEKEMIGYSRQIALELGLEGTNGVDFIQTENGPVVIEVNPRFQGSLDTIELSYGTNIFEAHMRSFSGELPAPMKPGRFAAKNIMYAGNNMAAGERLHKGLFECMKKKRAADIPEKGRMILKDEPLATLLDTGITREITLEKLIKTLNFIKHLTEV